MTAFRFFIKRILIAFLKLSPGYRRSANLPAGQISFEKLSANHRVLYQHDIVWADRTLPVTIGKSHKKFTAARFTPLYKTFVITAKNWRVWGNQGAVITNDSYLFADVSREFDNKTHSIFNQFKLIKPVYTKGAVAVLSASGSFVYYHWMFDILPRIFFLKQSGLFNQIDKFIINCIPNRFQAETLGKAGIPLTQVIRPADHWNFHVEAEELIVPSLVSPENCPSLEACQYLRGLFADDIGTNAGPTNLYIQRTEGRSVINESALLAFLAPLSFQIINPEKLSVAEQASIFSAAGMVIGPHGAGLTNIVFCPPGAVIIDLFSPDWVNPCYWIVSQHMKLKYGYLVGDEVKQKRKGKGADIMVNIDKLKALLLKLA